MFYTKRKNVIKDYYWSKGIESRDISKVKFKLCELNKIRLRSNTIKDSVIINSVFHRVDMENTEVKNIVVKDSLISGVRIGSESVIKECKFYRTSFVNCTLDSYFYISECTFVECKFVNCRFHVDSPFYQCKFIRCFGECITPKCPDKGEYIGYSKVTVYDDRGKSRKAIARLLIPKEAKRVTCGITRECRCDKVKVLDIYDIKNKSIKYDSAYVTNSGVYNYVVGEEFSVPNFDNRREKIYEKGLRHYCNERDAIKS